MTAPSIIGQRLSPRSDRTPHRRFLVDPAPASKIRPSSRTSSLTSKKLPREYRPPHPLPPAARAPHKLAIRARRMRPFFSPCRAAAKPNAKTPRTSHGHSRFQPSIRSPTWRSQAAALPDLARSLPPRSYPLHLPKSGLYLRVYHGSLFYTVRHHEAIKVQTLGDGLQTHRLETPNRYETHLDRSLIGRFGTVRLKERGTCR